MIFEANTWLTSKTSRAQRTTQIAKFSKYGCQEEALTSNLSSREEEVKAMSLTNLLVQRSKDQLELHHQLQQVHICKL